jgi:hypothetical protein
MSGDSAVALDDYPTQLLGWSTGFMPNLLQAIGQLAVVTAEIEQTLHQIYWKHAGLDQDSGPIVTDNLNPKRLSEDIRKFARLDPAKANIVADLELLLSEFEILNTTRNQCLHWIWEKVEGEKPPEGTLPFSMVNYMPVPSYQVKRPAYKTKGIGSKAYSPEDIQALCNQCSWVARRLHGHAIEESELRRLRNEADGTGTIIGSDGAPVRSFADIFWPAPWLDKPLPPAKKPSTPPGDQK